MSRSINAIGLRKVVIFKVISFLSARSCSDLSQSRRSSRFQPISRTGINGDFQARHAIIKSINESYDLNLG
jgi:hypothetical protein